MSKEYGKRKRKIDYKSEVWFPNRINITLSLGSREEPPVRTERWLDLVSEETSLERVHTGCRGLGPVSTVDTKVCSKNDTYVRRRGRV